MKSGGGEMNEKAMRSLLLFLVAWVVLAAIVTYALRRAKSPQGDIRFNVPVYAGARNVQREGAAEARWVRVTYELDARPPATQVVEYYEQQLPTQGWQASRRTRGRKWEHTRGAQPMDVLWRQWISEDELLRFDLYLTYLRGREAMPGQMTVKIEVGRNFPITRRHDRDGQTGVAPARGHPETTGP